MDRTDFEASLRRDGYAPAVEVALAPDERREAHTHPFAVRGLVLRGRFGLACDSEDALYGPGEVFELERDREHYEHTGAEGAAYLVGRRT